MGIKVFYGSDRKASLDAIKRILGSEYEVFEAEQISLADMDSIFYGATIFDSADNARKILIKDLSTCKECWEKLPEYANTSFTVAVLENKLSKTIAANKAVLSCKDIESREFTEREELTRDKFENLAPFKEAYAGRGKMAVKKLRQIQSRSAVPLIIGTMGSQAIKLIDGKNDAKAIRATKILAQADLISKTSGISEPWSIVEWALLEIANLDK